MRKIILLVGAMLVATSAISTEVYVCDEPRGYSLFANNDHKAEADSFRGVRPTVIKDEKNLKIVWGDSKSAGGVPRVWKPVVFFETPDVISAVAIDAYASNSASIMYTLNKKQGLLYMSTHKSVDSGAISGANIFISKCKAGQ